MVYVTVRQSPMYKNMTIEEFLFDNITNSALISKNTSNTKTYRFDVLPDRLSGKVNKRYLINLLKKFNANTEELRGRERSKLYCSFFIPKKSGGKRRIDAPNFELMEALRELKEIFETAFGANTAYHTSAFAYIKHRSTIDAIKRHQLNESRWFGKFDLSNFFGNTTLEFTMKQFSMIYPFSEVVKVPEGRAELERALELAFLNGGLPQGTPISPLITNIIMIPIDFALSKHLRNFEENHFIYTRYADDFIISCKYDFQYKSVENLLVDTLAEFNAPFSLNREKTRYGSSAGRNFNLGLMLNSDNEITIGYARKKRLKLLLETYVKDAKNGMRWPLEEAQVFAGQLSYFRMVEPETFRKVIDFIDQKYSANVMAELKANLK